MNQFKIDQIVTAVKKEHKIVGKITAFYGNVFVLINTEDNKTCTTCRDFVRPATFADKVQYKLGALK